MSASVFDIKLVEPTDKALETELRTSYAYLDTIKSHIKEQFGDIRQEWKFYGQKSGWVLKLFNKKRNVLFVIPQEGSFKAVFTFGDKAVEQINNSDVSLLIKQELQSAAKYMEGRTIQLEVKNEQQLSDILVLTEIKLQN